MNTPWKSDKWYVSSLNYNEEVMKEYCFAPKIKFHDVSLRDGEQQAGLVFDYDRKVALAEKLAEMGFDRIEAGMPAVSKQDEAAITEIVKRNLGPDIYCFSRCMTGDVQKAYDCGVRHLVMEIPANQYTIEKAYGWTVEKAIYNSIKATSYAHELGMYVVFFPMDGTRADLPWLLDLIEKVATQGHMDAVACVDTCGVLNPVSTSYMVKAFKKRFPDKPVEIHVHDDFDLGTANTLAAAAAGAEVLHTTISGIGERSGNAGYEAIAMALKVLYGQQIGLKTEGIYELAEYMQTLTGKPVRRNAPVIGKDLSVIESGIPVAVHYKMKDTDPLLLVGYDYTMTGHPPISYAIGKKSGAATVDAYLEQLDLMADDDRKASILNGIKELSLKKKSTVTVEEFREIALRNGALAKA